MGGMFSSPKMPEPVEEPVATGPTQEELDAQAKAEAEEAEMLRKKKGRNSTILTGSSGVDESGAKKTLLGE